MHKKQGFALPSRTPAGKRLRCIDEIDQWRHMKAEKSRNSAENSGLAARLAREITGDVFFDAFNRGRYATDASFYQIMPAGVVVPRTMDEALRALAIAATTAGSSPRAAAAPRNAARPSTRASSSTSPST